jgi:hypothetical protein
VRGANLTFTQDAAKVRFAPIAVIHVQPTLVVLCDCDLGFDGA